jgi:hypothetical protein
MDEAHPGKLIEMAGRAGEDKSSRHRDRVGPPAWTLCVCESGKVGAAANAIDELPKGSLIETTQSVARRTPQPLRKRQHWHADPIRLARAGEPLVLWDRWLAQLGHLGSKHPANIREQPILLNRDRYNA